MDVSKMRVSEWKRMGLLAFTEDGQVHFERSKVLIEVQSGAPERLGIFTGNRAKSRERKDLYEAENAKLDLDERCGRLTETKTIVDASATAGALVRSRAENMPDSIAPQLTAAAGDEDRCRAILAAWVDDFLSECSQAFASIASAARQRGTPRKVA
ncbi:MAG TPA: hypothetical protein VNU71_22695 [Burkholderiaceae bacterium]|nr:hypothetical protein [Burkholderiaceae bacterium]